MVKPIPVYVEAGDKKVFACSIDFPGWCRSAKTEELALEALAAYAPRYAEVAERARAAFPAPARAGSASRSSSGSRARARPTSASPTRSPRPTPSPSPPARRPARSS